MASALRIAQRWSIDAYGVAVMTDAAQQRIDHGRVAEEVSPFVITQVRCNNRGVAVIALLHQFEEDVGLFGLQRQIAKFVNQKDVKPAQAVEQLARGTVGQRGIDRKSTR